MRTIRWLLFVVMAGCAGSASTAPTMASTAGVWVLQSINGASLPAIVPAVAVGQRREILSDRLLLEYSGRYSSIGTMRDVEVSSGRVTGSGQFIGEGTWLVSGSTLTLTGKYGYDTGTLQGSVLIFGTYSYKKQ